MSILKRGGKDATEKEAGAGGRCGAKRYGAVRLPGGLLHCRVCVDVAHTARFRQGGISLHPYGGWVAGGVCGVQVGVSEDKIGGDKKWENQNGEQLGIKSYLLL